MDKFLQSGYGERALQTNPTPKEMASLNSAAKEGMRQASDSLFEPNSVDSGNATQMKHLTVHSGAPSFAKNSASIKPSVSFMNLSREQTKINHFVDLQDGPSSLQKREGIATLREKSTTPLLYESERQKHLGMQNQHSKMLTEIRSALFIKD